MHFGGFFNRTVPANDNPSIAQIELETAMMLDTVYVSISIPTTMKSEGRSKTVWQPVLQYLPFVCGLSALRELVDWLDRIAPDHDLDGFETGPNGIVSLVLRLDQEPTEAQIRKADTAVLYAQARSPWAAATNHTTAA